MRWSLQRLAALGLALSMALGGAAAANAATYKYDALGRLIQVVTDSGSTVTYQYDQADNRTARTIS